MKWLDYLHIELGNGNAAILALFKRFQNPPTSTSKDNQHIIYLFLKCQNDHLWQYVLLCAELFLGRNTSTCFYSSVFGPSDRARLAAFSRFQSVR